MSKKFSILVDPTFSETVDIPCPGRDAVSVDFTFKVKDRVEVADFRDRSSAFFTSALTRSEEETWGNHKWQSEIAEYEFGQLKEIVSGWDFDEPFDDEHLMAFVRSHKERASAVISKYLRSIEKAIEGN